MTKEHNFHPAYRADIDGLRAIAVLSVVAFHAFPSSLRGGFVGVDVFFVISGFLITSIILNSLKRGDFSFTEFYAHRIRRIFPALILVLTASYIFGWFVLLPEEYKLLGKHIAAGAGFVQNFVLYEEAGYFDTVSELKPLLHLWSLAIEEQFYLLYPLLIWGAWRIRANVWMVIAIIGLLSFGLNVYGVWKDAAKTFFLPQTRFWELLAGGGLAYFCLAKQGHVTNWLNQKISHHVASRCNWLMDKQDAVFSNALSVLGGGLIMVSVIGLHKGNAFPGWWALLPVIGAALVILAGSKAWLNRNVLANRPMVFVGLISYPLYLWHWPLLSFARIAVSEMSSMKARMVAVGLSFLLAWLTYHFIEKPVRYGRKTWLKTAILCLLVGITGFVGFNAYDRNGLPFRLKDQEIVSKLFPWKKLQNDYCVQRYANLKDVQYCLLSNDAPARVAIIGDSHANHLYPGLSEKFVTLHIGIGGCVPFFDVERKDSVTSPMICSADLMNKALDFAILERSIEYIVLAARYNTYLSGQGFGELEKSEQGDNTIRIISEGHTENIDVFVNGMRQTLKRLTASGKKVVFVMDVPEIGFAPKACIGLQLGLTSKKSPCAISRADFEGRDKSYRKLMYDVVEEFPSVKVVDPEHAFCDSYYCWALKDGKLLYRDDDHLSVEGSQYLANELMKVMVPEPLAHPKP